MRQAAGVILWVVATASGVIAAAWFNLAGLGWDRGFIKRVYWDEPESGIGIAFAVFSIIVWLGMLGWSVAVMRGGPHSPTSAVRVTSTVLASVSIVGVMTLCMLTIGWPEPPSEFPTPPWNRA